MPQGGTKGRRCPPLRLLGNLRGRRCGEVLLIFADPAPRLDVHSSFVLNGCTRELWDRLDAERTAQDSGPRCWLMDGIGRIENVEPVLIDFGGIAMRRVATIEVDGPMDQASYTERLVNRGAARYFGASTPLHELVSAGGSIHVMQAYCAGTDPTLGQSDLGTLVARLALPDGWRCRTRGHGAPGRAAQHLHPDGIVRRLARDRRGKWPPPRGLDFPCATYGRRWTRRSWWNVLV